jgi:hypothetical protein
MNISQDEKERAIFRSRKKFQMDLASDMATAEDRGVQKVALNAVAMGMDIATIIKLTGLTREEIERLRSDC